MTTSIVWHKSDRKKPPHNKVVLGSYDGRVMLVLYDRGPTTRGWYRVANNMWTGAMETYWTGQPGKWSDSLPTVFDTSEEVQREKSKQ